MELGLWVQVAKCPLSSKSLLTMSIKPNPDVVSAAVYEVVDNQLRDRVPPETRQSLDRLMAEGLPTMSVFEVIAFDADDTLWHNERLYAGAQARFADLLAHYHSPEWIQERLYQTETRNLQHFGHGIKAFALSMIETAIELTEGRLSGQDIQALIDTAKEMLTAEVELLEQVSETVSALARIYPLMVITKGDLLDQETKLARSGLSHHFQYVEVVSNKTREGYQRILKRYAFAPERFLMVGNSLRSDILPVLDLGGHAVYVPYDLTWIHEAAEPPLSGQQRYYQLEHIGSLPGLLEQIEVSADQANTSGIS
jgi:putative hydrolase of the HAD superfamily